MSVCGVDYHTDREVERARPFRESERKLAE